MSKQPEHKKENSDETVDSGVSMGFPSMSSDKERDPPPHDPEDSGFEATKRIFPITPDDPIVAVWESSLCKKIIGLIEPTPGWCAVDVIRSGYGLSAEENPVTILVAVTQDASIPEWQRLVRKMKDCCIK
jgi:hypothetical protein